ncbi:carboxylating nicotinate-nucleotide diphosphorylase [Planctomicrobium sp. SH527]|uniref:carboxylating nicotinate-nucleotide diphosphorylase n=1 Tax=Planctomicrobium sp. SH527 TaxID=3448123 RepID=UPI003F5BF35E
MQPHELDDARQLVRTALKEDLAGSVDFTTTLLIPATDRGTVQIVSRKPGVLCGASIIPIVFEELGTPVDCTVQLSDGAALEPQSLIAEIHGPVQALLTAERTVLNFLTFLSGIASHTKLYVDAVGSHPARILDTRKTLPGLRSLQKYAVKCGGGTNHRIGLYDAILVKDNHLADWLSDPQRTLAAAVKHLRQNAPTGMLVQFEVDTLGQLQQILPERPDMVLLDNMSLAELKSAVELRNSLAPGVLLEASGGVNLSTVSGIAATGVDRISVGALTHSAPALDIGFDWK